MKQNKRSSIWQLCRHVWHRQWRQSYQIDDIFSEVISSHRPLGISKKCLWFRIKSNWYPQQTTSNLLRLFTIIQPRYVLTGLIFQQQTVVSTILSLCIVCHRCVIITSSGTQCIFNRNTHIQINKNCCNPGTHDKIITSLLRQNDVATSFWRKIITRPCLCWDTMASESIFGVSVT